ncbi:pancreatic secretory granule membrane major glycoprotein GP2-like isoform X2 [Columba livia]|uniref:pancreatic secretory granule membrane major glycoprotein GP2-like isoform X2 n=1 Tax=Columba livia TaxID=8932 RepID=UPI0031BA298F
MERTVRRLLLLSALCLAGGQGNKSELVSTHGLRQGVALRLQRSPNTCLPNPCQHQGGCQVMEDRPVCNCKPGFTGTFCQDVELKLACEEEHMEMMVRKEVFELLKIPRELVHLKNQACKVSEREQEGELFFAATLTGENHTACGSKIQQNGSHVSYSNVIESEQEARGGVISRRFQLEVHFSCVYAYEQVVKLPFALAPVDKLVQFVVSEGHFNVSMRLYKTASYLQPYHLPTTAIPVTDTLYVLLKIEGQHQLKYFLLSIEDCWATPSVDPYQDMRHKLIEKGCPHDETVTYLNAIGKSTTAKFSFQMFQFVGYPEVFLHCRVRLCLPDGPEPCAKQCPRRWRSKRALADEYNKIVSYGPIHLLSASSLAAETRHSRTDLQGQGPGPSLWIPGAIILLCAFGVLTMAAVAVSARWRRM